MAKQDRMPTYPCMAPPPGSRLVHEPGDERGTTMQSRPLRKLLARLRPKRR